MRKFALYVISGFVVLTIYCVASAEPFAKGPYLGQTPPGSTPQVFAPGLICQAGPHQWEGNATFSADGDLTPNYVPTSIRELSTFFILQSGRRSAAEPGGLQLAAKAAGVI